MLATLRRLFRDRHYQPLNKIQISQSRLAKNYRYLSSLDRSVKVAPVLKSNAYGHGIQVIGPLVDRLNPPFICVDSLFEANQLRTVGVKSPILIMGFIDPSSLKSWHWGYAFTIFGLEMAKALNDYQSDVPIHIFVDTGMHREGITLDQLPIFIEEIKKLKHLRVEGLMSHFASADDLKSGQTETQVTNFKKALDICHRAGIRPRWRHLSNSAGLFNADNQICNMARVGKAIYGIDPQDKLNPKLLPVLKMTSKIAEIKQIKKGEMVGYNATYKAPKNMMIGVLPIGYNDGIDRRLSSKGSVLIDHKKCSIIGKVSMNVTTIDLSNIDNPEVGQEVLMISDNSADSNSIINIARACRTIPHEIFVHLAPSTRREVI